MKKQKYSVGIFSKKRQWMMLFLFFLLTVLSLLTGTRAWISTGQSALNMGQNTVAKKAIYLQKFERDSEGRATKTPIAGATFYVYQVKDSEESQIGGRYTTDKAGKISLELSPGDYYFDEIEPSLGYTFDTDKKGESIKKYPFTVTAASTVQEPIVIAYNQRQLGNLDIIKTVKNADGSKLTAPQMKQKFDFKVDFSDDGSYLYQIDGGEKQLLKSGATLQLKHEQKAVFEKLPIGVQYIVSENPVRGYESSGDNSSGTITESVSSVAFVNTYDPKVGHLEIAKEVVNGDGSDLTVAQKQQPFEFVATFSDPTTSYSFSTTTGRIGSLKSGETVSLVHDEVVTFFNLPIGLTYEIREKETVDYTSSPVKYVGTVLSKETSRLPFVNHYQIVPDKTGSLLFDKQIVANQIDTKQDFTFILTFSEPGTYDYQLNNGARQSYTSGNVLTLKHDDQVYFPELPAGLSYKLEEKPLAGYHSQLQEVEGTILSDQETHFSFHNYQVEKAKLLIEKIGLGEGFDLTKDFLFTIWINREQLPNPVRLKAGETSQPIELNVGDSWVVVEEDSSADEYHQTGLIHGTGVATTPNQTVTVTQTNRYIGQVMNELSGQKTWSIPKDLTVSLPESITVQLKDKETIVATQEVTGPEWRYTFQVPKYNEEGQEIQYIIEEKPVDNFKSIYHPGTIDLTNSYIAPIVSRELPIEKRITGDNPRVEESFEFRLSPSQQVVTIKGASQTKFDSITFSRVGTYVYTISEKNKGTLGYTYDYSSYTWTVVVSEIENELVITSDEVQKNGEPYTEPTLVFENHFDASKVPHEKMIINGVKTWEFGQQPEKERPQAITVLLRGNGEVLYQREIGAADDWAYSFSVNVYDQNGNEIEYSIDEVPLPNYQKAITGFNLKNTYIEKLLPGTGGEEWIESVMPRTGEKVAKYLVLLGGILVSGALILILLRKLRKSKVKSNK